MLEDAQETQKLDVQNPYTQEDLNDDSGDLPEEMQQQEEVSEDLQDWRDVDENSEQLSGEENKS